VSKLAIPRFSHHPAVLRAGESQWCYAIARDWHPLAAMGLFLSRPPLRIAATAAAGSLSCLPAAAP
jgi:hypothetical protein